MKKIDDGEPPYLPIPCDTYSEIELAIMHRRPLRLVWRDANVSFTQVVVPIDLETNSGREFLHARLASGGRTRIRLDRIDRLEPA